MEKDADGNDTAAQVMLPAKKVCALALTVDQQKSDAKSQVSTKKSLLGLSQDVLENEVGSQCVSCSDCLDEEKTLFCMSYTKPKTDTTDADTSKNVVSQCMKDKVDKDGKVVKGKDEKTPLKEPLTGEDVPEKLRCGPLITPPKGADDKAVPYSEDVSAANKLLMVDALHLHPKDVDQVRNGKPFKTCGFMERTDKDKKVTNFLQECATVTDSIGMVYERCVPRNLCRSMPLGMGIECNFTGRSGAEVLAAAASLMAVFYHTM